MKCCLKCGLCKKFSEYRRTYSPKTLKYYYRSYCNSCQNKIRQAQRKLKPNYKTYHSERCKKQYYKRILTQNNKVKMRINLDGTFEIEKGEVVPFVCPKCKFPTEYKAEL